MSPKPRRRLFRALWIVILLVVCALVLEGYGRANANRMAAENPYIRSHIEQGIAEAHPEARIVPAQAAPLSETMAENNRRLTEYFCAQNATNRETIEPAWARVTDESREDAEARRLTFPALSEVERHLAAALHTEIVVVLDGQGRVSRLYGASDAAPDLAWLLDARRAWLIGLLNRLPGIAIEWDYAAVRPTEGTPRDPFWLTLRQAVDSPLVGSGPHHVEAEVFVVTPAESPAIAYLFVRQAEVRGQPLLEDAADSPWEIPQFQYRPDSVLQLYGSEIVTNEYGLRNGPIALPKPDGIFRILCLGSSTTDQGFDNLSTWPKQLERMLRGEFGPDRVEVINAGIRGMRLADHLAKLPLYASFEPDLIVVYDGIGEVMFARGSQGLLRGALGASVFLRTHAKGLFRPSDDEFWQAIDTAALRNLRALAYWGSRNGVPVAVASIATPHPAVLTPEEVAFLDYNVDQNWSVNAGVPYEAVHAAVTRFNEALQDLALDEGAYYIPFAENYRVGLDRFHDIAHIRYHLVHEQSIMFLNALRPLVRQCLQRQRDPRDLIPLDAG